MNKRILVTGGAGFIGSHLCERLLLQGHEVICVDNFYAGRRENITHLIPNPLFEVIRHDVCLPLYVEVDEIYNLAGLASPAYFRLDPVQTVKTSVHGSINLLGLAKRVNAKILQVSTTEVRNHLEPINVRSCYGEGKRCAETLFFSYHRQHKTRIKIVRLENVYGPRMSPNGGRVLPSFVTDALAGRDLVVYNDGSCRRSFCYVNDILSGLTRAMNTSDDFTGPVNIGGEVEWTFLELAEMVIRLTGTDSKIERKPMTVEGTHREKPDIKLANDYLGWEPTVGLESGLAKTIEYFRGIKCK